MTKEEVRRFNDAGFCNGNCEVEDEYEDLNLGLIEVCAGEVAGYFMDIWEGEEAGELIDELALLEKTESRYGSRAAVQKLILFFMEEEQEEAIGRLQIVETCGAANTAVYGAFMDMFFDDDAIDWFLVEGWLQMEAHNIRPQGYVRRYGIEQM